MASHLYTPTAEAVACTIRAPAASGMRRLFADLFMALLEVFGNPIYELPPMERQTYAKPV